MGQTTEHELHHVLSQLHDRRVLQFTILYKDRADSNERVNGQVEKSVGQWERSIQGLWYLKASYKHDLTQNRTVDW